MSRRTHSRSRSSSKRSAGKHAKAWAGANPPDGRAAAEKRERQERFRSHSLPLLVLVFVAFLAYANAWPDNFVLDDAMFSPNMRTLGLSPADVASYFTEDVWASIGGGTYLYRPLLLVSIALDMQVFGNWMAGYHLVNILLHILVSVAVFGLVRSLLPATGAERRNSSLVSLLAALVFAVHPIHTEVVNSVFNRSDMLAGLGVIGGLWWFLQRLDKNTRRAWVGLGLIYLLALFCKETSIVMPALAVVVLWFSRPGDWRERIRECLPVFWLLVPLAIYLGLRAHALGTASMSGTAAAETENLGNLLPAMGLHLNMGKLLPAIAVWYDSLKLMVWPHPLFVFHGASASNEWFALGVQLAVIALALIAFIRKSPGLLVGLLFFYISILPASRIVGGVLSAPHLAERYLYLPSVGLTIALACGLGWLIARYSTKAVLIPTLITLILLTPVTWARNADWASLLSLAESDYQNGSRSGKTLQTFIAALHGEREYYRAAALCNKHADQLSRRWFMSATCGQVYEKLRRYDKAEEAYHLAMNSKRGKASAHFALATMYLGMNRRNDAEVEFQSAIAAEQQGFMKAYLEAEMLMQLYPDDRLRLLEAKGRLEDCIALQPQFPPSHQKLAELNERLGTGSGPTNR